MTKEDTKYPLVKRLRTMAAIGWNPIGDEAADEIERLQSKADALVCALTKIKNAPSGAVSFHDLRMFAAKTLATYKE